MIIFDDLSPYSRRYAMELFARYPEWRDRAEHPPADDWGAGALSVAVRSPITARELVVTTTRNEITVGFGGFGWHGTYVPEDDDEERDAFERSLRHIDGLLTEELAVLTKFVDGVPVSSELWWPDQDVVFGDAERVEIVSWLGARDAVVFPP